MNKMKIAVLVGSLRSESLNKKMANIFISLSPPSIVTEILEIDNLPLYNQDFDQDPPSSWVNFRKDLHAFDGVLFVTQDYNSSIPAVLKNALAIGSRPKGQNVWDGKPGGIVTVSPGMLGGVGANQSLRQSLFFLNIPTMQLPEAYIGNAEKLFDETGKITNNETKELARAFMKSFGAWVARNSLH